MAHEQLSQAIKLLATASLTPDQLVTIQNDLNTLDSAVTADNAAQAAVTADTATLAAAQATLATDTATQTGTTGPAVTAAAAQLLVDVEAIQPTT